MKKLILVRHGKSSWEYSVSDRDRPLSERGINDALLISGKVLAQNLELDAVFSSPANRAMHTAIIFMRQLDFHATHFHLANVLYDFTGDEVLRFLKNIDNGLNTVMVFGHNHAFTHIANSLGNTYIDNVPTCGLVEIEFDLQDWSKIAKGTTTQIIFPKQLRA